MEDDDLVFKALADPTRRLLLDRLFEQDGRTLQELEAEAPGLTRFDVRNHLPVLANNTVLESDPPRRLVHTWRSLYDDDMAAEPESRVTWEIEEMPGG